MKELSYLLSKKDWKEMYECTDPDLAYSEILATFPHHFNIACLYEIKKIKPRNEKFESNEKVQSVLFLTILKHDQYSDEEVLKKEIVKCKNKLKKAHNDAVKNYHSNRIRNSKNVTKETWNIIINNLKTSRVSKVNKTKLEVQGKPCSDPSIITNKFNEYYANVPKEIFSKLGNVPFDFTNLNEIGSSIYTDNTNACEVFKSINALSNKTSFGIDQVSNMVAKA